MSQGPALLIVRALILLLSFTGLCAGLRVGLRLHRMIAPFVAVSAVIALLMFGGMLGALRLTFYLLYFAGFGGLVYAYGLRRARPEWGLIAAMLVFAACLAWRFYPCPLYLNDDLSHWGLVARHLLRHEYMVGLTSIALLDLLSGEGVGAYRLLRMLPALSAVLMAAVAALYILPAEWQPWENGMRNTHYVPLRVRLRQTQAEYELPDGGRYLLYATDSAPYREYYYTKYEYLTADLHIIAGTCPYRMGTRDENVQA